MSSFGLGALKMMDMKTQDMMLTDQIAGHEIAGHEVADVWGGRIYLDLALLLHTCYSLDSKNIEDQSRVDGFNSPAWAHTKQFNPGFRFNCTLHCNVISVNAIFFVLQFHVLSFGPSFSCPANWSVSFMFVILSQLLVFCGVVNTTELWTNYR